MAYCIRWCIAYAYFKCIVHSSSRDLVCSDLWRLVKWTELFFSLPNVLHIGSISFFLLAVAKENLFWSIRSNLSITNRLLHNNELWEDLFCVILLWRQIPSPNIRNKCGLCAEKIAHCGLCRFDMFFSSFRQVIGLTRWWNLTFGGGCNEWTNGVHADIQLVMCFLSAFYCMCLPWDNCLFCLINMRDLFYHLDDMLVLLCTASFCKG